MKPGKQLSCLLTHVNPEVCMPPLQSHMERIHSLCFRGFLPLAKYNWNAASKEAIQPPKALRRPGYNIEDGFVCVENKTQDKKQKQNSTRHEK